MIRYRKDSNSKLEPVTDEMYNSWLSSAYSPVGEFLIDIDKYVGTYENTSTTNWVFKAKTLDLLNVEFKCQIKCVMEFNRFTNWEVTTSHMDSFPELDRETLGKIIWENSLKQFKYDITNIIPPSYEWKGEKAKAYKLERLSEEGRSNYGEVDDRYTKEINNVLLAYSYFNYLAYPISRKDVYSLILNPEIYRTHKKYIDNRGVRLDEKANSKIRSAISRVPKDIWTRTQGRQGGEVTQLAMDILDDYFKFVTEDKNSRNLRKESIKVGN
tara:strand:+ start:534 stop:1343 length:810 start_codon:yes stop_codon:yes gene_type:complete